MLFFRYGAIGCLCCGLLFLSGCGSTSLHETWKSTKGVYYTYLNPPASIDYDDVGDLDASEAKLANNMRPIDAELTRFERYMMNQDKPPTPERVNALFERFRWVNGVVALSPEGEVLAQEPETGLKPLDYASFVASGPVNPRDLRGDVQMTPLGPEVLLGVPVFSSADLKGFFVAHFDVRLLVDKAPDAAGLIIVSPQGVLWSGGNGEGGSALDGQDWGKITKSRIKGKTNGHVWICRYFGGVPLIFASSEVDGSAKAKAAAPEQSAKAVPDAAVQPDAAGGSTQKDAASGAEQQGANGSEPKDSEQKDAPAAEVKA